MKLDWKISDFVKNNISLLATLSLMAGVYLFFLNHGAAGGDANEFLIVANNYVLPHPPGYPLYALCLWMAKLFFFYWPLATACSLLSVLFSLAAGWFCYKIIMEISEQKPLISMVMTLLWGLSPLVVEYATIAEVFALNNLLVFAFLYFFLKEKWQVLAVLTGLMISHHQTAVIIALPFWTYLLWQKRLSIFRLLPYVVLGLFPLLLFFFALPPEKNPYVAWNELNSITDVMNYLLRKRYGTLSFTKENHGIDLLANAQVAGSLLLQGSLGIGLIGLLFLRRKLFSPFLSLLVIGLTLYLLIFIGLSNLPVHTGTGHTVYARFWQLPLLMILLLSAKGLSSLKREKILPVVGLFLALLPYSLYWQKQKIPHQIFDDYGQEIIQHLPVHAMVLTKGDVAYNTLAYWQLVKGERPDIILFDRSLMTTVAQIKLFRAHHPQILLSGDVYDPRAGAIQTFNLHELLVGNLLKRPRPILTFHFNASDLEYQRPEWQRNFELLPWGHLSQFFPKGKQIVLPDTAYIEHLLQKYESAYLAQKKVWPSSYSWERDLYEQLVASANLRKKFLHYFRSGL